MSTRRAPSASSGPMSLTANQTVPSSDHRRVARALIIPAWHAMLTIQPADRASQGDQLADVVVLRAPVVEGGEPAAHVPHARAEPVTQARRFSTSRSSSLTIQAAELPG